MEFDYYYGSQADQFSFIRIPRMLLTEDIFSSLTLQSKMLYSVRLNRIISHLQMLMRRDAIQIRLRS